MYWNVAAIFAKDAKDGYNKDVLANMNILSMWYHLLSGIHILFSIQLVMLLIFIYILLFLNYCYEIPRYITEVGKEKES